MINNDVWVHWVTENTMKFTVVDSGDRDRQLAFAARLVGLARDAGAVNPDCRIVCGWKPSQVQFCVDVVGVPNGMRDSLRHLVTAAVKEHL